MRKRKLPTIDWPGPLKDPVSAPALLKREASPGDEACDARPPTVVRRDDGTADPDDPAHTEHATGAVVAKTAVGDLAPAPPDRPYRPCNVPIVKSRGARDADDAEESAGASGGSRRRGAPTLRARQDDGWGEMESSHSSSTWGHKPIIRGRKNDEKDSSEDDDRDDGTVGPVIKVRQNGDAAEDEGEHGSQLPDTGHGEVGGPIIKVRAEDRTVTPCGRVCRMPRDPLPMGFGPLVERRGDESERKDDGVRLPRLLPFKSDSHSH